MKNEIKENKKLIEELPFLKPTDWLGNDLEDYDYSFTLLDEAPKGWRNLQIRFFREIKPLLVKANYLDKYRILQSKEKWGGWRLYDGGLPKEIFEEYNKILQRYEFESEETCIFCGNKAKMTYVGWICPICEKCWNEKEYNLDAPYEKAIKHKGE